MSRHLRGVAVIAALGASLLGVACQAPWGDDWESEEGALGMMCSSAPQARSYVGFEGEALDAKRVDENLDVNKARYKPFSVMSDEYKRVLGAAPRSLAGVAASFNDAPERWFAETDHSGVSLGAVFGVSLEGCTAAFAGDASKAQAPTTETATTFCRDFMTKAYSETPTDEQVGVCVDLATKKLTERDARRRWAHVCATILSSSQFLTF